MQLDEALTVCGERALREHAGNSATYSNWRTRGVPWEVVGPLVVEQLSLSSVAHSQLARHGGPDMHAVLDVQGRVFRLARDYGVESKEFRAVRELLTVLVPDSDGRDRVTLHKIAPGVPSDGAGKVVRTLKSVRRKR